MLTKISEGASDDGWTSHFGRFQRGPKNLKPKSLSLGGSSATDGLATPNLVWEDFSVQT